MEVLETILQLGKDRGIVEIGAGHGQWARALNDLYQHQQSSRNNTQDLEFVTAYDTMTELPLNANLYRRTQPAHDYFYPKVQECKNAYQVMEQSCNQGRILLMVFPSPGPMSLDTLKAYVATGGDHNTLVYVGEGREGANAPNEFFDYLEENQWIVTKILPVESFGSKGYEKMCILTRTVGGSNTWCDQHSRVACVLSAEISPHGLANFFNPRNRNQQGFPSACSLPSVMLSSNLAHFYIFPNNQANNEETPVFSTLHQQQPQ